MVREVRAAQPENMLAGIEVRDGGSVSVVSLEHPEKSPFPRLVAFCRPDTETSEEQLLKVLCDRVRIEEGRETDGNLEHPAKEN